MAKKLTKEHFLEGDISGKSEDFKEGVKYGVNNVLQEATLLIQSKLGHRSPQFKVVKKI